MRTVDEAKKIIRFTCIYGPCRTIFKVAGRLRFRVPVLGRPRGVKDIGMIGCGQFAFATIGYFVQRRLGRCILGCFDIDSAAMATLAHGLSVPHPCRDAKTLLELPALRTVYIASNHASHADYAVAALRRGLDVYVEKPVAVDLSQLIRLEQARLTASGRLFAGYNRPFSGAVRALCDRLRIQPRTGISMQCFVSGHVLAADHWYRDPREGTRICGNVGHWLDLFVHLLNVRGMPDRLEIALTWASDSERDDNLCIAISTDRQDVFSVMLTARSEPFEGINESIQFQQGSLICKIDDFRRMTIWDGPSKRTFRYWPKDAGHRGAVMQPFSDEVQRPWQEIVDSTLLMLHITDMVRSANRFSKFSFSESRACLEEMVRRGASELVSAG
jgi:predicted dehydrogenase